jgi:VanZ family protein
MFECRVGRIEVKATRITKGFLQVLAYRTAFHLAAWTCIVTIGVLSLAPTEAIARTGLGAHSEHVVAYAGTAFVTGLAFWEKGRCRLTLEILTYAGTLELLQCFSPGRTSSLTDYTFSIAGILVGTMALMLLKKCVLTEPNGEPFVELQP